MARSDEGRPRWVCGFLVTLGYSRYLANSALGGFAHRSYQIVMEGPSLRAASAPSSPKGKRRTSEPAASRG